MQRNRTLIISFEETLSDGALYTEQPKNDGM